MKLFVSLFAAAVLALPAAGWAAGDATREDEAPLSLEEILNTQSDYGESVDRVPFANQIRGYSVIDERHVVLTMGPSRHYLLSLRRACRNLSFDHTLGVSSTGNVIHAGFDYVTGEFGTRCYIERIDKVSREQVKALKAS